MTPLIVLAVLVAAVTHASWNAIAHGIKDQLLGFTLIEGAHAVIGLAMLPFVPVPAAGAWPYLIASVLLHQIYLLLLMRSFRLGDFGQMYPIARGTAPLVVTLAAIAVVDERLNAWQATGVVVASAGLVGVALWGIRGGGTRPHWPALVAAVGTGVTIASYTVVDGVGVRASGSPLGYTMWLVAMLGAPLPVIAYALRGRELFAQLRPVAVRGLVGGVLSIVAYGLVLWAQTKAPLGPVAALRESSIIVGAAIGAVLFKERFGASRMAAAGLMVAGIGLMLHGS